MACRASLPALASHRSVASCMEHDLYLRAVTMHGHFHLPAEKPSLLSIVHDDRASDGGRTTARRLPQKRSESSTSLLLEALVPCMPLTPLRYTCRHPQMG